MRLTPEQWQDAADLLDQFAQQCEIAFDDHDKDSKRWVQARLNKLVTLADVRGAHPRGLRKRSSTTKGSK